jgi:hypothetical protein
MTWRFHLITTKIGAIAITGIVSHPDKQRHIDRKQNDRHNTSYWTIAKIASILPRYGL